MAEDQGDNSAISQIAPTSKRADLGSEPSAAFTPGQHLQAIHQAFFNGGGWVDPLTWDDYDADGHAQWEAYAKGIAANIRCAVAAPDLLTALQGADEVLDDFAGAQTPEEMDDDPELKAVRIKVREAISKALSPPAKGGGDQGDSGSSLAKSTRRGPVAPPETNAVPVGKGGR